MKLTRDNIPDAVSRNAVLSACWGIDDRAGSWRNSVTVAQVLAELMGYRIE